MSIVTRLQRVISEYVLQQFVTKSSFKMLMIEEGCRESFLNMDCSNTVGYEVYF
jgi:hypothetical protein